MRCPVRSLHEDARDIAGADETKVDVLLVRHRAGMGVVEKEEVRRRSSVELRGGHVADRKGAKRALIRVTVFGRKRKRHARAARRHVCTFVASQPPPSPPKASVYWK